MSENNQRPDIIAGLEVSSSRLLAVGLDRNNKVADRLEAGRARRGEDTEQIAEFASEVAQRFGVTRLGIALPGLVSRETGNIAFSATMPESVAADFVATIRSAGVEPYVENDANAAAYAEFKLGAGRGSRNMFYATIGEGVGGAFIL